MLQIIYFVFIVISLASCGGGDSGTDLDDLNNNAQNPITLLELAYSVDEDTTLNETITYQNVSQLSAVPSVAITIQTPNGVIQILDAAAGTFSYTPDPDFNGVDQFTYTVTGPLGRQYTTTGAITVNPVNDVPVLSSINNINIVGGTISSLSGVVTDIENDVSELTLVSAPGWVSVSGLSIQMIPPASLIGTDQLITVSAAETGSALISNEISFTVSIIPNSVGFSSPSQTVLESDGSIVVPLELANASLEDLTVTVSVTGGSAQEGVDFTLPSTQVTFLAGQSTVNLPITMLDDSTYEQTESISLLIPSGQPITIDQASTEVLVSDNDLAPVLSFNNVSGTEGGSAVITFMIPTVIDFDVTAQFPVSSLVTFSPTSLSIPSGSLTQNITVTFLDNFIDEPDQNISLSLESLSNGLAQQAIDMFIADDDLPSTVAFGGVTTEVIEGNASSVLFTLDRPSGFDITIPLTLAGTAALTDYSFSSTSVLIPKGQSSVSVPYSIIEDDLAEGAETILITAIASTVFQLANSLATINVIDNEGVFGVSKFGSGLWLDTATKGTWGATVWQ